jgi:Protein of unknown function (DUF3306)
MSDHFFSRWSQRKQAVQQGLPVAEPLTHSKGQPQTQSLQAKSEETTQTPQSGATQANAAVSAQSASKEEPTKVLTLEDVAKLTPESDFTSYMTQGVSPEVRNAAMKKLLADPHYNIMDGLDIYIGDYNTPDPLPEGMLAKMVGAQFLGLVKAPEDVAQSAPSETQSPEPAPSQENVPDPDTNSAKSPATLENGPASHDHTHLRLQPNDAPADPEVGPGAG